MASAFAARAEGGAEAGWEEACGSGEGDVFVSSEREALSPGACTEKDGKKMGFVTNLSCCCAAFPLVLPPLCFFFLLLSPSFFSPCPMAPF